MFGSTSTDEAQQPDTTSTVDDGHEQRYEYTSEAWMSGVRASKQDPTETLNEYAKNGWQLVDRVQIKGTTYRFIFERPVGED